jgi:hypothetical protein
MNVELIREQLCEIAMIFFACGFGLAVIVAIFWTLFVSKEGR